MKGIIKWIILIGILVAIFGGANVKKFASIGINQGIDQIENGVNHIKKSDWNNSPAKNITKGLSGLFDSLN